MTQVEEMLVSAVMPIMTVYQLPHGQYGYKGHKINLPRDVHSFATRLPHDPSSLDTIIVRRQHSTDSYHDLRIRRSKVSTALQWLINNHIRM